MAIKYGLNENDFASSKLVSFASVFTRTAGQPLDKSQIWYKSQSQSALERAQQYAKTSSAYVGQELVVITDEIDDISGEPITKATLYIIQNESGTLRKVDAATLDDETFEKIRKDTETYVQQELTNLIEKEIDPIRSNVGTKTYLSLDAVNFSELKAGQIITIVDPYSANAYIVGYNKDKLYDLSAPPIPNATIGIGSLKEIIAGTYGSNTLVVANTSIPFNIIEDIILDDYVNNGDTTSSSIPSNVIEDIIEGRGIDTTPDLSNIEFILDGGKREVIY